MNNSLLKSVIALVLFYGTAAVIWLMLLPPKDLVALLNNIPVFMRPEHVPELKGLNFLNLEPVQKLFFAAWSAPILKAWLASIVLGIGLTVSVIFLFLRNRRLRRRPSGKWRTLTVSIGPLPVPDQIKRVGMQLKLKGVKLSKDESALLEEILGTLKAHPDAYVGAGHGTVTLYEHTMSVINRMMELEGIGAEHILAAAAHDMGKITSFVKGPDGSWDRVKMHAQESGRLLAVLPAWGRLPVDQREAIRLAVKNEHSPNMVPGIDPSVPPADIDPTVRQSMASDFRHPLYDRQDFRRRVVNLIEALRQADGMVTAAEKKVVLESIEDLPTFCLNAFLKALPAMPFYYTGVPTGFKGMVWQQGRRLYISEAKMRDHVMKESLSDEHHAALGGTYRGPKTIAPFTWHLLEAFKQKGWLVTKTKCYERFHKAGDPEPGPQPVEMECRPDMPLWDVLSGTKILNGMIIIDLNDDNVLARTPQQKLGFAIGAHRPHAPSVVGSSTPKDKSKSSVKLLTAEDLAPQEGSEKKQKKGTENAPASAASPVPAAGPNPMDELLSDKKSKKAAAQTPAPRKEPTLAPEIPEVVGASELPPPPTPADIVRAEEAASPRPKVTAAPEAKPTPEPEHAPASPPPPPVADAVPSAPAEPKQAQSPAAKPPGAGNAPAPKPKPKPKPKQSSNSDDSGGLNMSDLLN